MRTFLPPLPSTTFPVRLSTTLACSHPPSKLSSRLPSPPQIVTASTHRILLSIVHPSSPTLPGRSGRRRAVVRAMVNAPRKPDRMPVSVTPPFVPGGTRRSESEVRRRGAELERMPSSEEKVSAATAA
jgi:hypothetical protein